MAPTGENGLRWQRVHQGSAHRGRVAHPDSPRVAVTHFFGLRLILSKIHRSSVQIGSARHLLALSPAWEKEKGNCIESSRKSSALAWFSIFTEALPSTHLSVSFWIGRYETSMHRRVESTDLNYRLPSRLPLSHASHIPAATRIQSCACDKERQPDTNRCFDVRLLHTLVSWHPSRRSRDPSSRKEVTSVWRTKNLAIAPVSKAPDKQSTFPLSPVN